MRSQWVNMTNNPRKMLSECVFKVSKRKLEKINILLLFLLKYLHKFYRNDSTWKLKTHFNDKIYIIFYIYIMPLLREYKLYKYWCIYSHITMRIRKIIQMSKVKSRFRRIKLKQVLSLKSETFVLLPGLFSSMVLINLKEKELK